MAIAAPANRVALRGVKRVVVKVGSALLAEPGVGLASDKIAAYCHQIASLLGQGLEVVLVSSGAVAAGCARLGWAQRPTTVHELQAAAAIGQMGLAQTYETALSAHDCGTAMILLTHDDLSNRQRYLNARATLNQLLDLGIVPIINENDTVATEEIRFGDNDTLAALVTNLLEADALIILTDVDGLMDADPRTHVDAQRVASAAAEDRDLEMMAGAGAGELGRGGMRSKLSAARLAARSGAHTVIADGNRDDVLSVVLRGEDCGTWLYPQLNIMTARKRWIAGQLRAKGDIVLDEGAVRALQKEGVSVLAVGVTATTGTFARGDVLRLLDPQGRPIAQGLSNYASEEVGRLLGVRSEDFAMHIDHVAEPELVHRDNLALL